MAKLRNRWCWWAVAGIAVIAFGAPARAQTQPSVQPLAMPEPQPAQPAQPAPPAYPPNYYPPAQPYGGYPQGPARLRYQEGEPIPPGYHLVHRTRQGPVIAGTIVFLVSYGIALSAAMIDDFKDQTNWLAVPVAGPWLMMWNRSRPNCNDQTGDGCIEQGLETLLRFYLAFDGIAQAVGVGLFGFGMAGRDILVRDDAYASVHLLPAPIGSSGYGALLTGRF
jgi:hypothetical protein